MLCCGKNTTDLGAYRGCAFYAGFTFENGPGSARSKVHLPGMPSHGGSMLRGFLERVAVFVGEVGEVSWSCKVCMCQNWSEQDIFIFFFV